MRLAIMQPYLFPYIGIFQLISVVDKFVIYDDVNFIKQGWINRNRILVDGAPLFYSVPLNGAGSHVLIQDVRINHDQYQRWKAKFLRTLDQYYRKAPYFRNIMPLVESVLSGSPDLISLLAVSSLKAVCSLLDITTHFVDSSSCYENRQLSSQERVLDICRQEKATTYINVVGGVNLYEREAFEQKGVKLYFIRPREVVYNQSVKPFVPALSIIDILMFNSTEKIKQFIKEYDLI